MSDAAIAALAPRIGVRAACEAVGAAQAGYYRRHRQSPAPRRSVPIPHRERAQPRALSTAEQQLILHELHSDRFADMAPAQAWAILLDEGRYLGSIATFYRLRRRAGESRERRRQATHPATVKPGTGRRRTQRGVVMGHHQAARPGEVDLLPPLRDLGHLLA